MPDETKNPADDVEKLLKELGIPVGPPAAETPAPQPPAAPLEAPRPEEPPTKKPVFEKFTAGQPAPQALSVDALKDISMNLKVELGRRKMLVQEVLKLSGGSIVELDKLTGDPLDIYVNDRLVARGEILVINDNFAIRVTEIVGPGRAEPKQA